MSDLRSLSQRYRSKLAAIRLIISPAAGQEEIRESEDFDRDGIVLRSGIGTKTGFRAFISHEFLSDFEELEIAEKFQTWRVVQNLKQLKPGFTFFVTTEGCFTERTDGRTLREVTDAFERVVPLSERRKRVYDRVFDILVDGRRLGEIPTEMQGDTKFYITYSEDFANQLSAAYLLDAAEYRDFELRTTSPVLQQSGVTFEVVLATGEKAFLDFKRAIDPAERRSNALREQVNVGLRRLMREDAAIRSAVDGRFIQVTLPSAPRNRSEVQTVLNEIASFVTATDWKAFLSNTFVAFDAALYPVISTLGARVYMARGSTYLSVDQGARALSFQQPFSNLSRIISEEREKVFPVHPIWLGISLADALILEPWEEVFDARRQHLIQVEETPFEKIIVGSADKATILQK